MKVSEVIKNLEFMNKTYGDLEVEICIENEDEELFSESSFIFSSDLEKIYIQNFPF